MPEFFHFLDLREETVAPDIKFPAVTLDSTADSANDRVALVDNYRSATLDNFIGGSEARWAATDNNDRAGFAHGSTLAKKPALR